MLLLRCSEVLLLLFSWFLMLLYKVESVCLVSVFVIFIICKMINMKFMIIVSNIILVYVVFLYVVMVGLMLYKVRFC